MTELNLEYVNPHDVDECAAGMARLRDERDRAIDWAVRLENDERRLQEALDRERGFVGRLTARLVAHGIDLPGEDDDVTGAPV